MNTWTDLVPDQQLLLETTRRFLAEVCPMQRVRAIAESETGFDLDIWRRGCELGWSAMLVPERHGGGSVSGAPLVDLAAIAEELGRGALPGPFLVTNVVADTLASALDPLHEEVLAGVASGECLVTWAIAEPSMSSTRDVRLPALRDGGHIAMSGSKRFVPFANVADFLLVTARTEQGDPIQVLVPRSTPGVTIRPLASLDLTTRLFDVDFENIILPATRIVSPTDSASNSLDRQFEIALVLQCADSVGIATRIFDATLEYAQDRVAFGRPIGSYQALKHRFADLACDLEASKATLAASARAIQGRHADALELAMVAKSYITPIARTIVWECQQIFGGIAMTWEHDLHFFLRRAATNTALYGSPSHHRDCLWTLLAQEAAR